MEVSPALSWCLLAAVLSAATAGSLQGGSRIVFPVTVTLEEVDACTMHSGAPARCTDIRHCDFTDPDFRHNPPIRCGFQGIFPVVCCPAVPPVGSQPITDIAPPPPTFQCGKNSRNMLTLSFIFLDAERKMYIEQEDLPSVKDFIATRNENREDFDPIIVVLQTVGSVEALENAWPWMALVGERQGGAITWFCGAVLINEHWVLSALHCFFDKTPEVVRLGEHNYKDDNDGAVHQDFDVTEVMPYPGYAHPEAYHDLALLRLASRVPLQKFISPVCLPWGAESEVDITGHQATLTGYGDTELGGIPTSYLQEVNMTVFSSARCDTSYSNLTHYAETWPQGIGQETLCAGHPDGGRDACQGDSGGPLMSQDTNGLFVLAGIVSQGYGCGNKDYPGQYANLRYPPYLAWIKKVAFTVF